MKQTAIIRGHDSLQEKLAAKGWSLRKATSRLGNSFGAYYLQNDRDHLEDNTDPNETASQLAHLIEDHENQKIRYLKKKFAVVDWNFCKTKRNSSHILLGFYWVISKDSCQR